MSTCPSGKLWTSSTCLTHSLLAPGNRTTEDFDPCILSTLFHQTFMWLFQQQCLWCIIISCCPIGLMTFAVFTSKKLMSFLPCSVIILIHEVRKYATFLIIGWVSRIYDFMLNSILNDLITTRWTPRLLLNSFSECKLLKCVYSYNSLPLLVVKMT